MATLILDNIGSGNVCCLTAPSHYLNQCWLIISELLWHSPESKVTSSAQVTILNKLKNDMFRREGSSGYHSFYGWLKVHWVCIFRRKGHYILGISIFTIFWSLKVRVTFTESRKWSKTCMKAIYCAFESWDIIFLSYEILGTIWVPWYGYIEV